MSKRSQEKRLTLEAKVLRFMRVAQGISLNQAGRICNITGPAIVHIEQGRMDVSRARIETMVQGYGYTMDEFYEYMDGKPLPTDYRQECEALIHAIDDSKIQLVHGLLQSFAKS